MDSFRLLTITALLLLFGFESEETSLDDGVNPAVGDLSWRETYGEAPPGDTTSVHRIVTHLQWVEVKLRLAQPQLSAEQQRWRESLIDELHRYTASQIFPQHQESAREGRRPRFVDHEGRNCAVAHLIAESGHQDLVNSVQKEHEFDAIAKMNSPALREWAQTHGFTLQELAMIQPTYDDGSGVHMPTPWEEREAREERRREAKIPRPLKRSQVQDVLRGFVGRDQKRECLQHRTGHWKMQATLRISRARRVRASIEFRAVDGTKRMRKIERCFAKTLTSVMTRIIKSAAHRLKRPMTETLTHAVDVYSADEIGVALLSQSRRWYGHGGKSRVASLASCMKDEKGPLRVPLVVSSWNGEVGFRWDDGKPSFRSRSLQRTLLHCVQTVLSYGDLRERGTDDYNLTIEVLKNGTLKLSDHPIPVSERRPYQPYR